MSNGLQMNRRRVLRGMMGGAAVSVGLPFLDCFLNSHGTALADGTELPTAFSTWFWGCGLNPGRWEPSGVGAFKELGPELMPLKAFQAKMNVFSGMKAFVEGKPFMTHYSGAQGTFCGSVPRSRETAQPSIDTLVADAIGGRTRFRSIEVACEGIPTHSQSQRAGNLQNPAEISPVALYGRIFGTGFKDPNAAEFIPDPAVMTRKSALSIVAEERQAMFKTLGAADKARLDEYFTNLRLLEQQLELELEKPAPLQACTVPSAVEEARPSTEIETATINHALFTKLLTHALACGQTRVSNVVFGDALSTLRKRGGTQTHHEYTHEEPVDPQLGYQPEVSWFCQEIMRNFAVYLTSLQSVKEGDRTLLDRMLVMSGTDHGYAKIHSVENMPVMTVGNLNGRVKSGLHIQAKGDPISRVGLTVQQAFGMPIAAWGTDTMETSKTIKEIIA
jgi:hypothetical protein